MKARDVIKISNDVNKHNEKSFEYCLDIIHKYIEERAREGKTTCYIRHTDMFDWPKIEIKKYFFSRKKVITNPHPVRDKVIEKLKADGFKVKIMRSNFDYLYNETMRIKWQ